MRTLLLSLLLAGCAARDNRALQAEIADLQARVQSLEETMAKVEGVVELPGSPEDENAAMIYGMRIREAMDKFQMERARDLVTELIETYPNTTLGRAAVDLAERLEVIGTPAGKLDVVAWLQGEASFDKDRLTLVVFMEEWCPYCRKEAPELQARHEALDGSAVDIIGMTNLSRGTTEESMLAFLSESGVTFPVGHDSGLLSTRFRIETLPSAVLIRDGKVVWSGHPGQMSADVLLGFLSGS